MPGRAGQSGQVAVETALSLPLALFLILGTLQLFMMLQARVMSEYAAFRATRAGSVNHGDCRAMTDAAILALMPTYHRFLGTDGGSGTPGQRLARAWDLRRTNRYFPAQDGGHDGAIVWLVRESPRPGQVPSEDVNFDQHQGPPMRLEVRLVYWFPLRIPFADWVMSRMFLAQWGLRPYTAQNPLMVTQTAEWREEVDAPFEDVIAQELVRRINARQYVFPIQASYTMRMMTPAQGRYFTRRNCAPTPEFP